VSPVGDDERRLWRPLGAELLVESLQVEQRVENHPHVSVRVSKGKGERQRRTLGIAADDELPHH